MFTFKRGESPDPSFNFLCAGTAVNPQSGYKAALQALLGPEPLGRWGSASSAGLLEAIRRHRAT